MAISKSSPILLSILFLFGVSSGAQPPLQRYNVDTSQITVSGISSGAAMATQFHFAHSVVIVGAGIVSGVPYCCGYGGATTVCMKTPSAVNMALLIEEANSLESRGFIDSTSNITGDKVFIWHGARDSMVLPPSGQNVQEMYEHFGAQIMTEFTYAAEHGFPTNNYGAACGSSSANTEYLNNCNYKGAYHILNYLYGNALTEPNGSEGKLENLLDFDQAEFFTLHPSYSSMDSDGYIYAPTDCRNGAQCKLHISFHGCAQSKNDIGNVFATKAGYMEVAELNNIIVLFPQIYPILANSLSCWDWYGYLQNPYFGTKDGNQVLATYRMMTRVSSG